MILIAREFCRMLVRIGPACGADGEVIRDSLIWDWGFVNCGQAAL